MEKAVDLRVQRTYKLLMEALIALLSEKKFEDIQVAEICERAMIRRATFYKHFGDKYELFLFMVKEVQREFHEKNEVAYDRNRPQTYYAAIVNHTLSFLEQNKEMVTSIINSSASHILIDMLSEQIERDAFVELKKDEERGAILPGKPKLLAPMFTGMSVYTARWWVLHNWEPAREEIVRECLRVFRIV